MLAISCSLPAKPQRYYEGEPRTVADASVRFTKPARPLISESVGQSVVELAFPPLTTGRSFLLAATMVSGGANFSIFFRSAASIELLFFDRVDDARPLIIGMYSCPRCEQVRFTDSGPVGRSRQIAVSGLIQQSYSSIPMVASLSSPGTIAARQPV
jgi:hypothetical protein